MKHLEELDARRLDYKEMSDKELAKNQGLNYSFKFMETTTDKDYARKAMVARMSKVMDKISK